jgi:hypothetical protein
MSVIFFPAERHIMPETGHFQIYRVGETDLNGDLVRLRHLCKSSFAKNRRQRYCASRLRRGRRCSSVDDGRNA